MILAEVDQKFKGLVQTYDYVALRQKYPTWDRWRLTLGVDLSFGKTENSDMSAIVGVGQPLDKIETDLLAVLQMMNWNVCGLDASGNQEYFTLNMRKTISLFNKTAPKKITTPLRPMDNPGDKVSRITSNLQPRIASGGILLRSDEKVLFDQLSEFPHSYKDGPDALEYAVRTLDSGFG